MLYFGVLNQSTPPIASTFLSCHHPPKLDAPNRSLSFAPQRKTGLLYFQSFTHSSQFVKSNIPSIFLSLRTLCQKHPGVGSPLVHNFPAQLDLSLNPIESIRFTNLPSNLPSNPFRILLFQNMYPLTPLPSISFMKVVAGCPSHLRFFRSNSKNRQPRLN